MRRSAHLLALALCACAPPASAPPPAGEIGVCVLEEGALRMVAATRDGVTGDTLIDGVPFASARPADDRYAEHAPWQVRNEPFTFLGACFVKYGRPRTVPPEALIRVGVHRGMALFTDADDTEGRPNVVYVPLRPGCVFQTYQWELLGRPCEQTLGG